jgi:hypothetical protein
MLKVGELGRYSYGHGLDDLSSVPGRGKKCFFFPHYSVQNVSRGEPSLLSSGYQVLLQLGPEVDHSDPLVVRSGMVELCLHSPILNVVEFN